MVPSISPGKKTFSYHIVISEQMMFPNTDFYQTLFQKPAFQIELKTKKF